MDTSFKMEKEVFNYRVAAVWIENGYILLHKQTKESYWALPGGRAEMLEDSKSCLAREMAEELDVDVTPSRLLWVTENFFTYNAKKYHELGFYYEVEPAGDKSHFRQGPFFGPEGERLTYQWVPLADIAQFTLYPEFLRSELSRLPDAIQHVIISEDVR